MRLEPRSTPRRCPARDGGGLRRQPDRVALLVLCVAGATRSCVAKASTIAATGSRMAGCWLRAPHQSEQQRHPTRDRQSPSAPGLRVVSVCSPGRLGTTFRPAASARSSPGMMKRSLPARWRSWCPLRRASSAWGRARRPLRFEHGSVGAADRRQPVRDHERGAPRGVRTRPGSCARSLSRLDVALGIGCAGRREWRARSPRAGAARPTGARRARRRRCRTCRRTPRRTRRSRRSAPLPSLRPSTRAACRSGCSRRRSRRTGSCPAARCRGASGSSPASGRRGWPSMRMWSRSAG